MKFIDNIKEGLRNRMKRFLQLDAASEQQIQIQENMTEETRIAKNTIWYRGDSYELSQLYQQLPNKRDSFWGAVASVGLEIRKIHTGLPALIVDTLTDITMSDYNGIKFENLDLTNKETWSKIEEENGFNKLLSDSITSALYKGEGAYKVSFDEKISTLPIIEYFGKDEVEIIRKRERVREIIFRTYFKENGRKFLLKEIYGYGYVLYKVYDEKERTEYKADSFAYIKDQKLEDLKFGGAEIDKDGKILKYGSYMLAVPFKIKEHAIYDKKTDNFDAFDEAWSQWMNALRDGRTKTYIPRSLIPRNPNTGELTKPNPFDNKFVEVASDGTENAENKIITESPNIKTDPYMNTYITALDSCLQGIISPSTLGIDTKKITDPNATAQREKEKTTLWTRGKIIDALQDTIPKLVNTCFKAIKTLKKEEITDTDCSLGFGEYANPSFEAQVETIGKGKINRIMSIETCVDELYGDSKDDNWKSKEVARLKAEEGIVDMDEPAVNYDVEMNGDKLEENIDNEKENK